MRTQPGRSGQTVCATRLTSSSVSSATPPPRATPSSNRGLDIPDPRSHASLVGHLPPTRARRGSGQHLADLSHAITQNAMPAVAKSPDLGASVGVGDHRTRHAGPSGPPIAGNRMVPSSWRIMVPAAWQAIAGRSADPAPDSFTWAESGCRPSRGPCVSAGPTARRRTARFKYLIPYVVYLIYVLFAS